MQTNKMTLDERERFHFANGDVNSAWLIRETEDFTADNAEHAHDKALKAAENDGYEMGVKDTTPDAMREKLEALDIELIAAQRIYKIARDGLISSVQGLGSDLCKTAKGRSTLLSDLRKVLRYLY